MKIAALAVRGRFDHYHRVDVAGDGLHQATHDGRGVAPEGVLGKVQEPERVGSARREVVRGVDSDRRSVRPLEHPGRGRVGLERRHRDHAAERHVIVVELGVVRKDVLRRGLVVRDDHPLLACEEGDDMHELCGDTGGNIHLARLQRDDSHGNPSLALLLNQLVKPGLRRVQLKRDSDALRIGDRERLTAETGVIVELPENLRVWVAVHAALRPRSAK